MTLPDSECKRIKQDALKWYPETMDSLEMQTRRAARINGANTEASLWYERMGKFAEMQGKVVIGNKTYVMSSIHAGKWYLLHSDEVVYITTPELINEFLKIK